MQLTKPKTKFLTAALFKHNYLPAASTVAAVAVAVAAGDVAASLTHKFACATNLLLLWLLLPCADVVI